MVLTQPEAIITTKLRREMFPYHYGSHATHFPNLRRLSLMSFPYHYGSHATNHVQETQRYKVVSIPLWFSRNLVETTALDTRPSFHTTMVLTQPSKRQGSLQGGCRFPYHYGSHATLYAWVYVWRFAVSIPLWFSRNQQRFPVELPLLRFHTTMVLTQQRTSKLNSSELFCFHTTMVLTQLDRQYPRGTQHTVSIPLWFSRNVVRDSDGRIVGVSFHTTMVLTQHNPRTEIYIERRFPYHYGSHATFRERDNHHGGRHVSIPLWFSRNLTEAIKQIKPVRFHTTMVLTQREWVRSFRDSWRVSIPLWFSRNES